MGATAQADILFELGMMYATGRDCDADLVAAHKWFNIAAIKGSDPRRGIALRTVGHDVEGRHRPGAARSARMDDDALTLRPLTRAPRLRRTEARKAGTGRDDSNATGDEGAWRTNKAATGQSGAAF